MLSMHKATIPETELSEFLIPSWNSSWLGVDPPTTFPSSTSVSRPETLSKLDQLNVHFVEG